MFSEYSIKIQSKTNVSHGMSRMCLRNVSPFKLCFCVSKSSRLFVRCRFSPLCVFDYRRVPLYVFAIVFGPFIRFPIAQDVPFICSFLFLVASFVSELQKISLLLVCFRSPPLFISTYETRPFCFVCCRFSSLFVCNFGKCPFYFLQFPVCFLRPFSFPVSRNFLFFVSFHFLRLYPFPVSQGFPCFCFLMFSPSLLVSSLPVFHLPVFLLFLRLYSLRVSEGFPSICFFCFLRLYLSPVF